MLGALALAGCAATTAPVASDAPANAPVVSQAVRLDSVPEARLRAAGAEVLFWSQEQREANFRAMETIFPGHVVKAGARPRALPAGTPLAISPAEVDGFMAAQKIAGLIVLKDGQVVLERYGLGFTPQGRWTSFSVAKSFTSTLVGAAIRDGAIRSVDDPVTRYIPELAGSGYDGVSVAQLLTMTSGVRWNEDYTDPNSDVARMLTVPVPPGMDPTVAYMRTLPRETAPGEKFVYKTGETNLIGVLVSKATGKPLANYLSEKVWRPYGMEADAFWMIDQSGQEIGGCCLSVSLRDYARMGQLVLDGGEGLVPAGWFAEATKAQVAFPRAGFGYGYQWWAYPEGRFGAQGIFGQSILIDPAARVVVAMVSAWPKATDSALSAERMAFQAKLLAAAR
ncbi:beta-lactamase family protein [Sphingomonas baiyangensis]|uniref:Beta-lactamase family protein n=2 Tax=Sphingomonas baiyangensis TaxID=2572576 RepID=A0A4U1LAC7_9SPHN|nr:beta-lactamase family protein [Sphingomonas baiyangensis]